MIRPGMSSDDASTGAGETGWGGESRERGARRRKLAGYLKAANELRQSYQQSYGRSGNAQSERDGSGQDYDHDIPGAFPDVAIVRSGDEEMVLFPSYAKRHVKKDRSQQMREQRAQDLGTEQSGRANSTADEAEYWRREWERHEDDKAVVDVDIRGWIYAPHRGPLTRKNRLLIGLARQLSGVPAPSTTEQENGQIPQTDSRNRHSFHEDELVSREAESILKKGEGEADVARRGGYSEAPSTDYDRASIYTKDSRASTPELDPLRDPKPGDIARPVTNTSLNQDSSDVSDAKAKRASWNQPANMSPKELAEANTHLMTRLMPFLTNPLPSVPITMFFYSDATSQSRTTMTNEAGHFSERFALDFVPTHVRVLASESLSATEDVRITEPYGVSLISDIDDTIKHSAIGSGAREIFRNTFIRDLSDLTIEGVTDWYKRLADMGVRLHYVSNAPWQLYPLLVRFFTLAGLPSGSFHLKQYSGMLQGIFEPVAERKKSTLERIMHDFPERKFVLVGDSGEADLEVYTDIVTANPGRVIGVFIRDVTTPKSQGFFDSAMGPFSADRKGTPPPSRKGSVDQGKADKSGNEAEHRPPVPPKRSVAAPPTPQNTGPAMGTLIDLSDDASGLESPGMQPPPPLSRSVTDEKMEARARRPASPSDGTARPSPPPLPAKPSALRGAKSNSGTSLPTLAGGLAGDVARKAPPPPTPQPRRPSNLRAGQSVDSAYPETTGNISQQLSQSGSQVMAGTRQILSSAYDRLPASVGPAAPRTSGNRSSADASPRSSPSSSTQNLSIRAGRPDAPGDPAPRSSSVSSRPSPAVSATGGGDRGPPPPPPRRNLSSYPVAAAQYASCRIGWPSSTPANPSPNSTTAAATSRLAPFSTYGAGNNNGSSGAAGNTGAPINKKEELWKRRWARARETLVSKGVELRSWRVGEDVVDDSVRLVQRALKEAE